MRSNRIIGICLLYLTCASAHAQFDNEWIDYSQTYFKIKVTQDGFYRITAAELEAKGFVTAAVPANRIQLFRRGEEVAIQVNATGGVLNYFEFYGQKNDGSGDTPLYLEATDQPHTYYNLFTDTAAYFLTWKLTTETGKRMANSSLNDFNGLSPQTYHLNEIIQLGTSDYSPGLKFGTDASFTLADYDSGEGWTGNFVSKGGNKQFNFTLANYGSGPDPYLEVVLVGGNTLDHNVDILVGPSQTSLRTIGNMQFSDRNAYRQVFSFLPTDVGAGGALSVRLNVVGFDGAADRVSTALVRVVYPQTMSMTSSENKVFYLDELEAAERAYFRVTTTNAAGTQVYEITDPLNPVRITTTSFSDRLECLIPGPYTSRKVLTVTSPLTVADIDAVTMTSPNVSSDYLIITHPALRAPASDGLDPVQAFATYRASVQGGAYTSTILNIFDVYNQFNYGDVSPLAVKQMADYALATGTPKALLLIGKGRTPDYNFYRNNQHSVINIPTYGEPGGDLMFTKGLGASDVKPALAVSRINAYTVEHVKAYLDKVKEMEQIPYADLFRKNVLQLSGGQSVSELTIFRGYIQSFAQVLSGDYLGGRAINLGKETSQTVEVVDVVDEINSGVGLVTFFGHSSNTVTDIEIGRVSTGDFGYANQGKYPVFLVNGCNAGDIFGTNVSFGEDWMRTPNLGAIGFIAHANFASSSALKRYSDIFYQIAFAEEPTFGLTLGELQLAISSRYFDMYGSGRLAQTQVLEMLLQGDPMIRIFGATQPDFDIHQERVWVDGFESNQVLASQDSFRVNMIIRNYGRTVTDPLLIQINRTLPQGEVVQSFHSFERPLYQDTLVFYLYNEIGQQIVGMNTLDIFLDPANATPELNESNNYLNLSFEIFQGNTSHLYPPDFSVYSNPAVQFHWQPTDILQSSRSYDIEIDSVTTFDSPLLKSYSVSGQHLLSRTVDFTSSNLPDTTVLFWRTRFTTPQSNAEEGWEQSSFTLISNSPSGWGQFTPDQFVQNLLVGVSFDTDSDEWEFIETDAPVGVTTFGTAYSGYNYNDLRLLANGIDYLVTSNTIDPQCATNTINALVFDRESTNPYRPIAISGADVFSALVCGRLPQVVYNLRETDVLGANAYLETLINNMKTGDHIVLFNIGQVNYTNWDADVRNALEQIGVSSASVAALTNGQPVIILGRKGDAPGTAVVVANNGSATPLTQQSIQLDDNIFGVFTSGRIVTDRVGPAKAWTALTYQTSEEINDVVQVTVRGITPDGQEVDLFQFARRDDQDLSTIDAQAYPWLKFYFELADETNLTPPQLGFWTVLYERPPEGMLFTTDTERSNVVEGQDAVKTFSFYNLSPVDFTDNADITAVLRGTASGRQQTQTFTIDGPAAGDTTTFDTAIETIGQDGLNNLSVQVSAIENEEYTFNNDLILVESVRVSADNTNPVLDVTFDGAYIMNGDIVSPEPTIIIRMKDDNSFIQKSDTLGMEIKLKRPCEGCILERVNFTDPNVQYAPASSTNDFEITYLPGPLTDGIYSLSVQGRDESGNAAGTAPYEIEFEVVTTASITHFYPYPNPFSSQTRFVFTLTGSEVPDKLKIQIMTISGRIVKEINQDEIGPIKIGHNITEYAWDGTDEFGDPLANGVYFYRVVMPSKGEALKHRRTSADKAFKNGFGKLYILR